MKVSAAPCPLTPKGELRGWSRFGGTVRIGDADVFLPEPCPLTPKGGTARLVSLLTVVMYGCPAFRASPKIGTTPGKIPPSLDSLVTKAN